MPINLVQKHYALMELLLLRPELTKRQLAEILEYDYSYVCKLTNDLTFSEAFAEYKRDHHGEFASVADLPKEAKDLTVLALRKSKEFLEAKDEDVPVEVKQKTISEILSLGHASGIRKTAEFVAKADIPTEEIKRFFETMELMALPSTNPVKRLEKKSEEAQDAEIIEKGI